MICKKCGATNEDGVRFCANCGKAMTEATNGALGITDEKQKKFMKITGIIDTIAGAILILLGFADIEYDWGIISLIGGVGILVAGILQLTKKSNKVISILNIVFGGVLLLISLCCEYEYDWTYIGMGIAVTMLVVGILGILRKSAKAIGIVEIVFAGILLILGLACLEYDWGLTSLTAGAAALVAGILRVVYSGKNRQ